MMLTQTVLVASTMQANAAFSTWWLIPAAGLISFAAYFFGRRIGHGSSPGASQENMAGVVADGEQHETPTSSPAIAAPVKIRGVLPSLSRLYTPAALDFWWVQIPTRLRRYSVTFSAAWADGIYLTAWPRLAVWLSIFAALVGCGLGAAHWSPYAIADNSIAAAGPIIIFAESLPFLFVAAVLGGLSAHLGVMLTLGYVAGDYLIAGPAVTAWGYNSGWPAFFGQRLPLLLCYWLLFMLAARTTLTSNSLAASLLRSVRGNDTASKILRVAASAAFQFALVYAWTLATPMIIRVLWIWIGRGYSPLTVPGYQAVVDPWVPLAASTAVVVRGSLMHRALARNHIARRVRRLKHLQRYADAAAAFSRRLPVSVRALIAAAGMTLLMSGLLLSFEYAAGMFLLISALLLVRALVLPKLRFWTAWAHAAARVPLAARLSAGALLVFLISRFIVAAPGPLNSQGKFGIELICLAIGLALVLLLAANGEGAGSPIIWSAYSSNLPAGRGSAGLLRKAAGTAVLLFCVLGAGKAYAACVDDYCCLVTFAIAGLLVGALIILGIEFLLPMMGIDLLATLAEMFPGLAEFFAEDVAPEALKEIADAVDILGEGNGNCPWVAGEVDEALEDLFAGRTPNPYAPYWYESADNWYLPDAAVRGEVGQLADLSTMESEYGSTFGSVADTTTIAQQLQTAGNGARGIIYVSDGVNAHVFNAVNYGGRVFFIDGQVGVVTTSTQYLAGFSAPEIMFIPTF